MAFEEVLAQLIEVLQHEKRISYRALKRRFALDDAYLDDLTGPTLAARRDRRGEVGGTGAGRRAPHPVDRGRPPLGRSDHDRVAQPCSRPGTHHLALSARDLPARVSVAVG